MTPKSKSRLLLVLLLFLAAFATSTTSFAHAVGENYVFFNFREASMDGEFQIHIDDLRDKLGVPIPEDVENIEAVNQVIVETAPKIHAYIVENFSVGPEGEAPYDFEFVSAEFMSAEGGFGKYIFRSDTGALPDMLAIEHNMLYDDDKLHRGLVLVQYNEKTGINYGPEHAALIFSPSNRQQVLDLTDVPELVSTKEMIWQGVLHIWIGIDHILFLVALLLPTVLLLKEGSWQPVGSFRKGFFALLKIVTVFTVAHSVTLLLAALDIVQLNSRFVESMIALSIVLVAVNNITRTVRDGSLVVILVLGLFHGLGFATVMGHLPFRIPEVLKMVIRFNIGVELGQLVIVCLLFPALYLVRKHRLYVPVVLKGGSVVLILIAGYWFVQRALGLG